MRLRLPPLEQIEAFVEAARAPSFRVAAERCALSPAAFSRRIQAFAGHMGADLFERRGASLQLTELGQRCLAELEPAYLELRRAAAGVVHADDRPCVRLALSHSLTVCWVIPRLKAFRTACPGLELSFRVEHGSSALRNGDADLGIFSADTNLAGLEAEPLMPAVALAVASPQVAATLRRSSARLEDQPLLALTKPGDTWAWWAKATGRSGDLRPTATFDVLEAMYEAAAQGVGVALAATPTIHPYLKSGRLVDVGLPSAEFGGGYMLAAAPVSYRRRAVAAVWAWLKAEAAGEPDVPAVGFAARTPHPVRMS